MGIFRQFSYSNFHDMNMDEIIKIMRQMQDEWEATKTEWNSYKEFIDNYFENLDVSQEVLEAMRIFAYDGTLNAVLDPTIATATAAWLASHITPTTPAIDASFSVNGAGADAGMVGRTILHFKNTAPNEYNSVLANIILPLIFVIGPGAAWTDKPAQTGIFTNQVYNADATNAYCMQTFYEYPSGVTYMRFVAALTPAVDWKRIDANSVVHIPVDNSFASYDRTLGKVNINTICPITASKWDDLPEDTGLEETDTIYILTNQMYNGTYFMQHLVTYPSLREYLRIVNTATGVPTVQWKLQNQGSQGAGASIVYDAIGDSITAGCYSNDQGEGVEVTDASWAYPAQMTQRYGCIYHNHSVPGAKLTQMLTQAQAVATNASLITIMGGVNDYIQGTQLGTVGAPDTTTCAGSLASIIVACINRAPNARIVLVSPLLINRGSASTHYSANYRAVTFTMNELNEVYKNTAKYYNVEFIDGLNESPINYRNITQVLKDGTHPTITFYKTVSNWIGSHLF